MPGRCAGFSLFSAAYLIDLVRRLPPARSSEFPRFLAITFVIKHCHSFAKVSLTPSNARSQNTAILSSSKVPKPAKMVSVRLALLALASTAAALSVTSPTSSDVWTVGESQTVTWDTVSSDQSTFNIYLSNMVSYPSTTILLASDVSKSAGKATIDGSKLTAGDSFTINFTNGTETEQLYAQSVSFYSGLGCFCFALGGRGKRVG